MPDLIPLRLAQANHGIFYGPQYAAMSLGFFRDEGLDVQFSTANNGPGVAERLLRDEIDVGRAGPIRTLGMAERGHVLVNVAEVNSRGGFYLLGRRATAQFAWSDLAGASVIAWGEPAIPWLCTAHVLEREGVDLKSVRVIRDVAGDKMVDAFRSGIGDYIAQFQPEAELLLADGTARTVVSMAEAIGPIPFSSYVVTPRFLARHPDRVERFLRGFQRALSWVHSHPAGEIAAAIAPFFPGVERPVLERSVERYLQTGPWPHDAILRKPGFEYLQDIVVKGGVVSRRYAYEAHVNTEIASRVAARR
jgi:NitT/TauT family transport system substrate-binding protein